MVVYAYHVYSEALIHTQVVLGLDQQAQNSVPFSSEMDIMWVIFLMLNILTEELIYIY